VDARAVLAERTPAIDRALEAALPAATEPPAALHAAMRHLVFPGGKRLRPVLALVGAEAAGAPPGAALPLAVAVELVHTWSLVHDDLPCMDDDDERRGRPTVHVAYGEATAVLAGDALLALAFEHLARAPERAAADPARTARVLARLARTAGSRELVGGQVDDLALQPGAGAEAVESVHARKSAALLAASLAGGALLAGADEARVERLDAFGRALGVAFQIADDLLDAGRDEASSLVAVCGEAAARARAGDLLDEALRVIEDWGERAAPLRALARYAVWRER